MTRYLSRSAIARELGIDPGTLEAAVKRAAVSPGPDCVLDGRPGWFPKRVAEFERWRSRHSVSQRAATRTPVMYIGVTEVSRRYGISPHYLRRCLRRPAAVRPDARIVLPGQRAIIGWRPDRCGELGEWIARVLASRQHPVRVAVRDVVASRMAGMSWRRIGDTLGVSHETARRIHQRSM